MTYHLALQTEFYSLDEAFLHLEPGSLGDLNRIFGKILANHRESFSFLASEDPSQRKYFVEILFFSCFALRQMKNISNSPVSRALASHLMEMIDGIHILKDGLPLEISKGLDGLSLELSQGLTVKVPTLTTFRGNGKKRFVATLDFDEKTVQFKLSPTGFGGFGMLDLHTNYYVFSSVIALLRYLKEQHLDNRLFISRLAVAAWVCGKAILTGDVSLTNQSVLALFSAKNAYESCPS